MEIAMWQEIIYSPPFDWDLFPGPDWKELLPDYGEVASSGDTPPPISSVGPFINGDIGAEVMAISALGASYFADGRALVTTVQRYNGAIAAVHLLAGPLQTTLHAGLQDEFGGASEPASPGAEIAAICSSATKDFDDLGSDTCFAHTFTDLPAGISAGTVEIKLKAPGTACNDAIQIQAVGGSLAWSRRIGSDCSGDGALGVLPYSWGNGSTETLVLDLAALPNADGSTTNLMALLNADGRLDVRVNDDTGVDYIRVQLTYSDPAQAGFTYAQVQHQNVLELVEQMAATEFALSQHLATISQLPEMAAASATYDDIVAYQASVVANGLPAVELAMLQEMGATSEEISLITAYDAQSVIAPFAGTYSLADLLAEMSVLMGSSELSIVASLAEEGFPLSSQSGPVECLDFAGLGLGGAELACGPSGIAVDTTLGGQGGIVIKKPEGDWVGAASISTQLGDLDASTWPLQARIAASSSFQTGIGAFATSASVTKVGPDEFELFTDVGSLDTPSKRIQIWQGGAVMFQVSVAADDVVCSATDAPQIFTPWGVAGQPAWKYEWATPTVVALEGHATFLADAIQVIAEQYTPTPQLYLNEMAIEVQGISSFTVESVVFGSDAPLCQPSLGFASDPTARISVCGGDLSTGTESVFELFGAPPFAPTLLFVGLQSNPMPVNALSGAYLVPLPELLIVSIPAGPDGGHLIPIPGGGGPVSLFVQEVILGPNTVTNAVEIQLQP